MRAGSVMLPSATPLTHVSGASKTKVSEERLGYNPLLGTVNKKVLSKRGLR
jgi:hypothetical protein